MPIDYFEFVGFESEPRAVREHRTDRAVAVGPCRINAATAGLGRTEVAETWNEIGGDRVA